MQYETRIPIKAVVIALAVSLAATGIAVPVNAAEKANTELDSVTYSGWGDPAMAQIAVDSGRALIDHLTTARTLLDSGKIDQARAVKELKEAADEVSQHTVYLPVEFVQQQVRVARHALYQKQPDVKTAKTAVQHALDSLVVVVDSVVQTASR